MGWQDDAILVSGSGDDGKTATTPPTKPKQQGWQNDATLIADAPKITSKPLAPAAEFKRKPVPLDTLMRSPQTRKLLQVRNRPKFEAAQRELDLAEGIGLEQQNTPIGSGEFAPSYVKKAKLTAEEQKQVDKHRAEAERIFNEVLPESNGRRWINHAEALEMGLIGSLPSNVYKAFPKHVDPTPEQQKQQDELEARLRKGGKKKADEAGQWYEFSPKTAEWLASKDERKSVKQAIKGQAEASFFPSAEVGGTMTSLQSAGALAARGLEAAGIIEEGVADAGYSRAGAMREVAAERDRGSVIGRLNRGTAESFTTMGLAAGVGVAAGLATGGGATTLITPAIIATFAAGAASEAYADGIQSGMTEAEAKQHAKVQGAIEGGITAAFQVVGAGGLEAAAVKPFIKGIGKDVTKSLGGKILKNLTAEQLEELSIAATSEFASRAAGLNPTEMHGLLIDTFIQTAATMGFVEAPGVARAGIKQATGMTVDPIHGRAVEARKWIRDNSGEGGLAEMIAARAEAGQPISREMMTKAGLKKGTAEQRERFGKLVYRTLYGEKIAGSEIGEVATDLPEPVAPAAEAAPVEPTATAQPKVDPEIRDARLALSKYAASKNYADPKRHGLRDADTTYQTLKEAADKEGRSEAAKAAARTKKVEAEKRDEAYVDAATGYVNRDTIKYAPVAALHPELGKRIVKEARRLANDTDSADVKATLQKIIDGSDKDAGAAVEAQRDRIVGILLGEVDQRTGPERERVAPRPADPVVQLLLMPAAERVRAVRKSMKSLADGEPDAIAMHARAEASKLKNEGREFDDEYLEPNETEVLDQLNALAGTVEAAEQTEAVAETEADVDFDFGANQPAEGSSSVPVGEIGLPTALPEDLKGTAKPEAKEEFGGKRKSPIAKVMDEISKILGGSVVKVIESEDGNGVKITLRNGRSFTIRITAPIRPTIAQRSRYEASKGRKLTDDEFFTQVANGIFNLTVDDGTGSNKLVGDAMIRLSRGVALKTTPVHELVHMARAFGLFTDAEWSALKKKHAPNAKTEVEAEEAVAKAFEDWHNTSAAWKKLKVLVDKILSLLREGVSATRVQQAFSSGEVFGRKGELISPRAASERWSGPAFSASAAGATTADIETARRAWTDLRFKSPFFQRWFGGSKIADKFGQPIRMYHGRASDFDAFDMNYADPNALYGPGIYTSDSTDVVAGEDGYVNKGAYSSVDLVEEFEEEEGESWEELDRRVRESIAEDYPGEDGFHFVRRTTKYGKEIRVYTGMSGSPNVMPLYVSIKQPFDIDADMESWPEIMSKVADLQPDIDVDYVSEKLDQFENNEGNATGREVYMAISRAYREDGTQVGKAGANAILQQLGYDGIVHTGGLSARYGKGVPHKVAIAFKSNQVKSAIGNIGTFDEGDSVLFSAAEKPRSIWRDNILDSLLSWQSKGTPVQLMKHLEKTRGAVDQAKWIGLEGFLEGKKTVTYDEVSDFVVANSVDVQEVVLGAPDKLPPALMKRYEELQDKQDEVGLSDQEVRELEIIDRTVLDYTAAGESTSKYSAYQVPGGKNYRELLLTLPPIDKAGPPIAEGQERTLGTNFALAPGQPTIIRGERYESSHWPGVPNILAHVRYNERTTADGKRMLFIEENQSDWHQSGRKRGYNEVKYAEPRVFKDEDINDIDLLRPVKGASLWYVEDGRGDRQEDSGHMSRDRAIEAINRTYTRDYSRGNSRKIPDAPFKTSWPMLVMKRMIQEAAERGFDRIGWTTGAMQAARYDLSKQVSKIGHGKNPDGTFAIKVISTDGTNMWESEKATINEIEEQLGKEMAEKIAASDDLKWKTIEGDGLKVGGKGMIGFYDDILPAAVNKFVKKWGVKVGTSKINGETDVHSLDINDAMIADAAEGMPLFSASGPQVNYERPKGGAVGSWVRWMFTSASDLPKQAFALKENMQQFIAAHERAMSFAISDLRKAVKKTYGTMPKTNSAEWSAINDVLRGGDIKTLPARMRDPIWRMRSHIDNLSKMIIESGVANENLEATIEENMGVYLTRTYRVHADRKWSKRVPLEVRTRAEHWIREQLALENGRMFPPTDNEVQQRINELLYTDTAAESPMGIIAQGKLGSKLLDVLKARKELPIELRELWGEETNPLINYAASVAKMTKLLAGQRFLTEARQSGLGKWLFEANDPNIDPEAKATIAAPGSDVMNPLNGLKTYPEVKVAFETEFARRDLHPLFKLYIGANSLAKAMKTVGSLTTQIRNFVSNVGFSIANGHWRLNKAADAIAGAIPGIEGVPVLHLAGRAAGKITKAILGGGEIAGKKNDAWREFHLRLIKNGVIGEDVAVGEFKKLLSDANIENMGRLSDNVVMNLIRGTAESAAKVYQTSDALWKVFAWGNERARYKAAFPEWSDEQLDKHAADIVRNIMPTYSKIPKGVQAMRHLPVGNFFSWSSEIIRVSLKTIQLAMEELKDPRTRKIGATRLAGISAMTLLPEVVAGYSLYAMGMTKEDDEDKREFLPPWSKNSNIYWMGDGKYIDVSFSDSYAYVRKAVHAYMRGDEKGVINGIVESAKELGDPFFTEQLLGERIADVLVRDGETADGRKVYNKEHDLATKAGAIVKHILAPLVPTVLMSAANIKKGIDGDVGQRGKVYDPMIELIALFGLRISKIDIAQSLGFKVSDHDRAITDSNRIFNEAALSAGAVSAEELTAAYDLAETARRRNFDNMHDVAWKAIRQGVGEAEVRSTLKARGLSKEDADRVISGKYAPLMPSAPTLANIAVKPDGEDRVTEIYRLFITRSPDPEAAEESVRDKLGKRLKSANTTIRRSKLVDAQIQRLKPKAGETADERRERLADYQRTLQRAKRAKESISKLQAEEFGGKRVP